MRHDNWVMVHHSHQIDDQMNPIFVNYSLPNFGRIVFALIENDCDNDAFVAKLVAVKEEDEFISQGAPLLKWKIVDFDPKTEEEILQQKYTVVAWRYIED